MHDLRATLQSVAAGALSVEEAVRQLQAAGRPRTSDLGFATLDLSRQDRCGFPEVVYCAGKSPAQAAAIAAEIVAHAPRCLLTRADADHAAAVQGAVPAARYHEAARCIVIDPDPLPREGLVAIVAAGTTDLPVAQEAQHTAAIMGAAVATHWDVGVAGLHRLVGQIDAVRQARVIIAIAGMEGALASVVGGLVDRPVIAVPTSVGAGMHLDGLVPLLAMLNSCAPGVGVVNVDNGFGAGYLAALINRIPTLTS